jgi:hypothetical protein
MKGLYTSLLPALAYGHGAVNKPQPRNAVDQDLAPWNGPFPAGGAPNVESKTGWCPVAGADGKPSGVNGQSCFWFSNGCAIGCEECDGASRGPIPWSNDSAWARKFNVCNQTDTVATLCDPAKRTVNTNATCGADDDWYYYSPWRRPGNAPVFDSCGMAGGHAPPDGGFGGIYVNTTHAHLGDKGSVVLPVHKTGTTWTAGSVVEVAWTIEANHGGGYIYRLARADGVLTEDEFNKIPLPFVGQQQFRWNGGKRTLNFTGTYVSEGTTPLGSVWARNPVPRNDVTHTGQGFKPYCDETDGYRCSGAEDRGFENPTLEIVDHILIPDGLPAGEYVLGWRWDCEESNQIWQSCSDVTIVA